MLDFLRRGSKSWAAKGILIAVAASFIIGFGILPSIRKFTGTDETTIATVNGQRITTAEYEGQLEKMRNIYRDRQVPDSVLETIDLEETVLRSLIQKTLLIQASQKLGTTVPDSAVIETIRTDPRFQENGVFSRDRYLYWCTAQGLAPAGYEEEIREALAIQFLQDTISLSAQVSEEEVKQWIRLRADQVSLDALTFSPGDFLRKEEAIPEDEAKTYFEAHKADFKMPPRVGAEHLTLTDSTIEKDVKVTEEEVRAAWRPKRAKVREILLKVPSSATQAQESEIRSKAEDLAVQIHDGADFGAIAKKASDDEKTKTSGGDLGWVSRGDLDRRLDKIIFEAMAGALVGPVLGPNGFYLLKVEEFDPTFDAAKIRQQLTAERVEKLGLGRAKDLRLELTQKADFKTFAGEKGLAYGKAEEVPADGTGQIAGSRALAAAAVAMKDVGQIGMPVRVPGGYAILKLTARLPERDRTFEEARPLLEEALRAERSKERAKAKAEEAGAKMKAGAGAAETGKALGGTLVATDPFNRLSETVPKVGNSEEMVRAAFELTEASPVADKIFEVGGKFAAVRLRSRSSTDPAITTAEGGKEQDRIVKQLLADRQSERMQDWIEMLTRTAKIHINEDLLQHYTRKPGREPAPRG